MIYQKHPFPNHGAVYMILFVATLTMLLTSCSPPVPAPTPTPIGITTIPASPTSSGGNLIMPLGHQDPPTLDPALVGDKTSAFVVGQLFSGLVRLDNQLEVQPDVAERWDISDDRKTYTFFLRSNAAFADGTAITSEDIRYSLERATDPKLARFLPAQTYLNDIVGVNEKLSGQATELRGVNIINDHTIAITIDAPRSYFLAKLTHPTAFVVNREAVESGGRNWTEEPNASGPFVIEEWKHNQKLVLRRNEHFYRDQAKLDRVIFLIGSAASNPMNLYEQGKIDVTYVDAFSLARVKDASNPLSKELSRVPQLSLTYIGLNVKIPPFDDLNVRQAFALLLDRQKLAEVTWNNSVQAAHGILPPGMPGYNKNLPKHESSREKAKQLLAKSTYGRAANLPPIVAYGGGVSSIMRDVVKETFGITIEVRSYENFSEYIQAMKEAQLPMYSTSWIADYPDPQNFLDVLFRSNSLENHSAYANPEVDKVLDQAAVETNESTRWELYQQAEKMILDDASVIPIYHDVDYMLIKPYVKGLVSTPMGILDLSQVELIR